MDEALNNLLGIVVKIETILNSGSIDNEKIFVIKVQSLCVDLKGTDSYINEKASKISRLVKKYLSDSDIKAETHGLLNSIKSQISYIQSKKT